MTVGRIVVVIVSVVAALGAVTVAALEGREVVVVRTRDANGQSRATRTWVADADGAMLIEAANPERPFLRDLAREPAVELERAGAIRRCRAAIVPNPDGHARIRALLAAKYGWADRWIALLADTRRSFAVRLDCEREPASA
jgi:hypothetical protein